MTCNVFQVAKFQHQFWKEVHYTLSLSPWLLPKPPNHHLLYNAHIIKGSVNVSALVKGLDKLQLSCGA